MFCSINPCSSGIIYQILLVTAYPGNGKTVLILVLMEASLKFVGRSKYDVTIIIVLILVLMEVYLKLFSKEKLCRLYDHLQCLNPCSSGSVSHILFHLMLRAMLPVLILVLMEVSLIYYFI